MKEILISAQSTAGTIRQIRNVVGGSLSEKWGEHLLTVDNKIAKGTIGFITFDWGVSLIEYDIIFHEDISLVADSSEFNPIKFIYCLEGQCGHKFAHNKEANNIEQLQSVIITSKGGGFSYTYFKKGIKLSINIINIKRYNYLQKRLNNVRELNKKLFDVFMDSDHENTFAYYGVYNLELAQKVSGLRKIKEKEIARVLKIEGYVYQILSMHMLQHDTVLQTKLTSSNMQKSELKNVIAAAAKINRNVAKEYSLDQLSTDFFLSQAKLQEGFKMMFNRTVTEYIRHVRLELARELINTTTLNISQIVYSVGFSSRSYFSKIFKEKFDISPSEFQKQLKDSLNENGMQISAKEMAGNF